VRAAIIRQHGGLEAIAVEEVEAPTPGPGQALIAVKAVALNHMDLWARKGIAGFHFPLPLIPGCDMAGVVVSAEGLEPGAEVVVAPGVSCGTCRECAQGRDYLCRSYGILGETQNGGCAELAVVPRRNLLPKPKGLSFEAAAAYPLTFLTAWHMLVARAQVRPGMTVLVHAAGSGVSSAAIQIARLFGARVFATAGSPEKCARALALGAELAIDYRAEPDWSKRVFTATGKVGVDVVIDHVGHAVFEGSIRALRTGGTFVTCGATSGGEVPLDLRRVFFKNLSILGSTMGSLGELYELTDHVAMGRLVPQVDRVFPLSDIQQAHRVLEARDAFGKIVVIP
jgi:NADPH:quinone reductase-like Zn-dependent oxidoreductase